MGKLLKEIRKEKNLSQQELADLSGVSLRTIQRIEKGESFPSSYVKKAVSNALNLNPEEIIFEHIEIDKEIFTEHILESEQDLNQDLILLKYLNISTLIVLIGYLIISKKLKNNDVKKISFKIISFQILWSILTIILLMIYSFISSWFLNNKDFIGEIPVFVWIYWMLISFHLIITFIISYKLNKNYKSLRSFPNIL